MCFCPVWSFYENAWLAGGLLLFVVGCGPSGPKLHPVVGTVKVEGKPAEHALVFMHRKERDAMLDPLPYGTCAADGTFEIETRPMWAKALRKGEYTITVYWPDMTKPEDGNGQRPDALNGAYEQLAQSKIFASVKSGKNELPPMELKPGPPKAKAPSDKNIK